MSTQRTERGPRLVHGEKYLRHRENGSIFPYHPMAAKSDLVEEFIHKEPDSLEIKAAQKEQDVVDKISIDLNID